MESIKSKSRFQQAAMVSWLAPIAVIFINFLLRQDMRPPEETARSVIFAFLSAILYLLGLSCGIYSFFGIGNQGRKGILIPGSIGTLLNAGMLCFIALSIVQGMRSAQARSPDNSLTLRQYQAFGMPSLDHAWTPEDFAQASKALESANKEDPLKLPRRGSPISGALFARLSSSDESRESAADPSPLSKIAASEGRIQSLLAVAGIYEKAMKRGFRYPSEFCAMTCRMIEEVSLLSSAADTYRREAREQDPVVIRMGQVEKQRAEGAEQLLRGAAQIMKGLQTSGEIALMHELAQCLNEKLPGMASVCRGIPLNNRKTLFSDLMNHEKDLDTQKHLENIQRQLQDL